MADRPAANVFVSYRRQDTSHLAGRLYDRLSDRVGSAQVFMDVDSIEPGSDFHEMIARAVGSSHVLLALIGPGSAGRDGRPGPASAGQLRRPGAYGDPGRPRSERPRHTGARGRSTGSAPEEVDLPVDLRPIDDGKPSRLAHATFRADVETLVTAVARAAAEPLTGPIPAAPLRRPPSYLDAPPPWPEQQPLPSNGPGRTPPVHHDSYDNYDDDPGRRWGRGRRIAIGIAAAVVVGLVALTAYLIFGQVSGPQQVAALLLVGQQQEVARSQLAGGEPTARHPSPSPRRSRRRAGSSARTRRQVPRSSSEAWSPYRSATGRTRSPFPRWSARRSPRPDRCSPSAGSSWGADRAGHVRRLPGRQNHLLDTRSG